MEGGHYWWGFCATLSWQLAAYRTEKRTILLQVAALLRMVELGAGLSCKTRQATRILPRTYTAQVGLSDDEFRPCVRGVKNAMWMAKAVSGSCMYSGQLCRSPEKGTQDLKLLHSPLLLPIAPLLSLTKISRIPGSGATRCQHVVDSVAKRAYL